MGIWIFHGYVSLPGGKLHLQRPTLWLVGEEKNWWFTPLNTNVQPENQWLEDVFPTEIVPFPFLGDMLVFGGVWVFLGYGSWNPAFPPLRFFFLVKKNPFKQKALPKKRTANTPENPKGEESPSSPNHHVSEMMSVLGESTLVSIDCTP